MIENIVLLLFVLWLIILSPIEYILIAVFIFVVPFIALGIIDAKRHSKIFKRD